MSYCENCGQYLDANTATCPGCGTPNPEYSAGSYPSYNTGYETAPEKSGLNVMAIVAMALSGTGIVGLIFSIIALKNAKKGNLKTPLKPLAVAALIVSICMIVFWLIYIIVVAVAAAAGAAGYYYY